MKMKKIYKYILIIVVLGAIIGGGTVYYVFNKPHRNIKDETPAYTYTAKDLYKEYSEDEEAGNMKFGDKVIQVTGKIVEITNENNDISFVLNDEMESVNCALDSMFIKNNKPLIENYDLGGDITLKGKCDGFDMIMGVVLTQCFIVK